MQPKAGYDYLATAARFAAESSTETDVNVCTTDGFTEPVDALVYYIDPEEEKVKIAYPNALFPPNNQGMGDVEYGKISGIYFPPAYRSAFPEFVKAMRAYIEKTGIANCFSANV